MKCLLSLLIFAGCLPLLAQEPDLDKLSASTALGGPDVLATIENAQTLTAQRVDSVEAKENSGDNSEPSLVTLGEPFAVTPAEATALKQVFGSGKTYLSPSKTCHFRANVRYAFTTPSDKIEIVICFGCGEMEVWRGTHLVSFGPFDGGYGGLLAITKSIFPKDEFLAKFTESSFQERAKLMEVPRTTPVP